MTDPYASPRTVNPLPPSESAGDVLKAWVKLAALYNVVLTLVTGISAALLAGPMFMDGVGGLLIVYAMGANMCFLAGPATEFGYRLLGGRSTLLRKVLFVGGTLFASALALVTVLWLFQQPSTEAF